MRPLPALDQNRGARPGWQGVSRPTVTEVPGTSVPWHLSSVNARDRDRGPRHLSSHRDGFESGDTGGWESAVGVRGPPARPVKGTCGGSSTPQWTIHTSYVYRGDALLAEINQGDLRFYHLDHLGSVRQLTNVEADVAASYDYLPYGKEVGSSTAPLQFTGHERDSHGPGDEDNLDYMHARYYSPHLSRFVAVDPVLGDAAMPQSWNRYAYALNNPEKYIDPTGEASALVVGEETEENFFGHIAISIDDRVFSYGTSRVDPNGDWDVALSDYLESQVEVRESTLIELDISPRQERMLLDHLENNNPFETEYNLITNSCVSVCENGLEEVGLLNNSPGSIQVDTAGNALQAGAPRSLTPAGLVGQVKDQGLVKNIKPVAGKRVSKIRAAIGTTLDALRRYF